MKVEPSGLPTLRRRVESWDEVVENVSSRDGERRGGRIAGGVSRESVCAVAVVAFRRKSWVTAIPIEAKAREVRIQARKVRSVMWLETFLEVCLISE